MNLRSSCLLVVCLWMMGCVEPYSPPDVKGKTDLLVVDGFINATEKSARITLSTSIALDSIATPGPITNATINIESDDGTEFNLQETENGVYTIAQLQLDMSSQYRLNITLANNDEFSSDFISIKQTPPIDSVTFRQFANSLNIMVNTHQPDGSGQYYKWDFGETWEYVASFYSNYKMENGKAVDRPDNERIYMCWGSAASKKILVGSSTRLSSDVIRDFPLTSVPGGSLQLTRRYSIIVHQRALTYEEFNFWTQLRKTSENIGGLFDPQPYELTGNIHGTNNDNTVLGYFGGGEVTDKRIFLSLGDLPRGIQALTLTTPCDNDDITRIDIVDVPITPNSTLLIDAIYVPFVGIVGYTSAYPTCVDCRVLGGVTKKPEFW